MTRGRSSPKRSFRLKSDRLTPTQRRWKGYARAAAEHSSGCPVNGSHSLIFCTSNVRSPFIVDLTAFRDGQTALGSSEVPERYPFFSGRPGLIAQLHPLLYERLLHASASDVSAWQRLMRAWWGFFDRLESASAVSASERLDSVAHLTQVHTTAALSDVGIDSRMFISFHALASETRVALKLAPLHWPAPQRMMLQGPCVSRDS